MPLDEVEIHIFLLFLDNRRLFLIIPHEAWLGKGISYIAFKLLPKNSRNLKLGDEFQKYRYLLDKFIP